MTEPHVAPYQRWRIVKTPIAGLSTRQVVYRCSFTGKLGFMLTQWRLSRYQSGSDFMMQYKIEAVPLEECDLE